MRRTRTLPPVTMPIERVAAELVGGFARDVASWFDVCGGVVPKSARVWRRQDGGVTIRAAGRTPDGKRVSYSVKISGG